MEQDFRPVLQPGAILHFGALLLNISVVGFLIILALSQPVGGFFILYLILSLVAFIPVPIIAYRLLALLRAKYSISREGVSIRWGLRSEIIPISAIEWVRADEDIPFSLPQPRFSVEGAVLGTINHADLGPIEFISSTNRSLTLIATPQKVYAISPADSRSFINAFNRSAEMGSIEPIQAKSLGADFLAASLLKDKLARSLIFSAIILSIALLVVVSFIIPTRTTIPFGFTPIGQALETSPSERLLLLPFLSILMLVVDIALGAYFYRKEGFRTAAYFVFASALILPLSFLGVIVLLIL